MAIPLDVHKFWFGCKNFEDSASFRDIWFQADDSFDEQIREKFTVTLSEAVSGALDFWQKNPEGALALVLVLDQFSRNIFRGQPRAFSSDAKARSVARRAIDQGLDRKVPPIHRMFFYLPFEHSENLADQRRSVALFLGVVMDFDEALRKLVRTSALRHAEIIESFGRFPHRNLALGRAMTAAEIVFLEQPQSSF